MNTPSRKLKAISRRTRDWAGAVEVIFSGTSFVEVSLHNSRSRFTKRALIGQRHFDA